MKQLIITVLLGLTMGTALAQGMTKPDTIPVYAGVIDGEVRLRWLPPSVPRLFPAAEQGFRVERRASGTPWQEIENSPVMPISAPDAEAQARQIDDRFLGAVATLMNPSFGPQQRQADSTSVGASLSAAENNRNRNGLALLASFQSKAAAEAIAYYVEDRPAKQGVYQYRITSLSTRVPSMPGTAVANTLIPIDPPELPIAEAEWRNKRVIVSLKVLDDNPYTYFDIERRRLMSDGQTPLDSFTQINENALFDDELITYSDSLVDNVSIYEYRLRGTDLVFRKGPYTLPVIGTGLAPLRISRAYILRPNELSANAVEVQWIMELGDSTAVVQQQLLRSLQPNGIYIPISPGLEAATRSYTDTIVAVDQYYRVVTMDSDGRTRRSAHAHFRANDTIPPAAPKGLKASIDTNSVVSVTWKASPDADVKGYRLFYSLSRSRPGERITSRHETGLVAYDTLTLSSLGDSVFYRVVALDQRENVSDFSVPVGLALPDVHPPLAASILNAVGDTAGITLHYRPSPSDDIELHIWQRRAQGTREWYAFAKTAAAKTAEVQPGYRTPTSFRDSLVDVDYRYEYRLMTVDDGGLASWSNSVSAQRKWNKLLPPVEDLKTKLDRDEFEMVLEWKYPKSSRLTSFRIYRAHDDYPLTTLAVVPVEELARKGPNKKTGAYTWRLRDDDVRLGREYRYAVVAEWSDGSRGKMSEDKNSK